MLAVVGWPLWWSAVAGRGAFVAIWKLSRVRSKHCKTKDCRVEDAERTWQLRPLDAECCRKIVISPD